MADHHGPEKIWDEYDWERFLQQQDRKTERYMELLEKYMDDPNRDQIVAREMGWHHLLNAEGKNWAEDMEALFDEEMESSDEEEAEEPTTDAVSDYTTHPLYRASFALTTSIDCLFDDDKTQTHPAAVRLATQSAIANAKLAAALSDDDIDEIGMTIAYLKRALKAISNAMEAAAQLNSELELPAERYAQLTQRLFQVRDGIIALMGEMRAEWRRRFE